MIRTKFDLKLENLLNEADDILDNAEDSNEEYLLEVVEEAFNKRKWNEICLPDKLVETFTEHAKLRNAVGFIDRIGEGRHFTTYDISTGDFNTVVDRVDKAFNEKIVPDRSFCYFAWRQRPDEYWYVGKASSRDRIHLKGNGSLSHAVAKTTTLSLIFPSKGTADSINGLEASLIRLIYGVTGFKPKLNERFERVPEGEGSNYLRSIGRFFSHVEKKLSV